MLLWSLKFGVWSFPSYHLAPRTAKIPAMALVDKMTTEAGQRPFAKVPAAKRAFRRNQTMSGWYSGGCFTGFLLMSEGVTKARMSSTVTAQPKKFTTGAPYQSKPSLVGFH